MTGGSWVGVDFGLTSTEAVAWPHPPGPHPSAPTARATLIEPGYADPIVLERALAGLALGDAPVARLAVTGGRSRTLPDRWRGARVDKIPEPEAIGRGGLASAGLTRALVISCGTGTAMILADEAEGRYAHVTGTAVGGGTLVGLGQALVGERDPLALAALAERGRAAAVDTTLAEVLGGGVGDLPPEATAVNFGRLAHLTHDATPADLAAGLTTMIAQVIALIAINAARAHAVEAVIATGRLTRLAPITRTFDVVTALYRRAPFIIPDGGERATAVGAVLAAEARP